MKSRVPFCNGGLLRRDLTRTALLWAAYLILWFAAVPGSIYSGREWMKAIDIRRTVLEGAVAGHFVAFAYGLAVAWYLFSYLYKSRSANFFGSLPLRRETQFLTHYIAGLLCSFVPNFLMAGLIILAGSSCGVNLAVEAAIWFGAQSLAYVFYFSFAVLCAMLVGNIIAMPGLYVVLNFVVVVVEILVKGLLDALMFGLRFDRDPVLIWLSPLMAAMEGFGPDVRRIRDEGGQLIDLVFEGWSGLVILAAVGLVLAGVAFLLYRRRRMEAAGDVVAIRCLRPVFLYVFTFGCTLVGGMVLSSILVQNMESSHFWPISACLLFSTALGHFLGHMMLQRSLRVFDRKNWLTCGLCALILVVILGGIRIDIFGVAGYVPQREEVAAVRLGDGNHNVDQPELVDDVMLLHKQFLAEQKQTEAKTRQGVYNPMIDIVYVLKDGREVVREYRLPVDQEAAADPESLVRVFEKIYNTPEMILARNLPMAEVTVKNIKDCDIYYHFNDGNSGRIEPKTAEFVELWETAIVRDLKEGNMGKVYYTDDLLKEEKTTAVPIGLEMATVESYSGVSVELGLYDEDLQVRYSHYTIPDTAVHTKAALVEMGVPAEAFALVDEKGG